MAAATAAVLVWVAPIAARSDGIGGVPEQILSQCGLASGLLVAAVIYLAAANAKTRTAWEADRAVMASSYEKLAVSHAKLEGIILALRAGRGDGC